MTKEFIKVSHLQAIKEIGSTLSFKSIFLVIGQEVSKLENLNEFLSHINSKYDVTIYNDFDKNTEYDAVISAIKEFRKKKYDLVIAVGGGSSIDMAKLINSLAHQEGDLMSVVKGTKKIKNKGLPLVAIPTTAGTGSEVTHFAVVYIKQVKYSLAHSSILPDYALIDPKLSATMPPVLSAVTGLDALCQAIESFWSVGATVESRKYAQKAIQFLNTNIIEAVNNPSLEIREKMALGAYYSGKAINISKTTAPHALSYTMTTAFGVPHGHAVSLTLGMFFLINEKKLKEEKTILDNNVNELQAVMNQLYRLLGCDSAEACKIYWYELMKSIGLSTKLSELGITETKEIDLIINNVNIERLSNHPVVVDKDTINYVIRNIS